MLQTALYFLLNMSFAAGLIIATLLLIWRIRALPRRVMYPLWGLAFVRLVFPFSLSARWSLFSFTGSLIKRLIPAEVLTGAAVTPPRNWTVMNYIGAATDYAPLAYRTAALRRAFTIGAGVWAVTAIIAALAALLLYALTQAELRSATRIRGNLYRSDRLRSPVLAGILRPRILLPPSLDPDSNEGEMVLAHENVHRKRLDNLWRVLAVATACVHWFNPLVWIMLRAFFTDMEQSCDEEVLRSGGYKAEQRKAYALALLRFSEDKRTLGSAAFGRSGVRARILNVLNYRRLTTLGGVLSLLFALAAALALLTNPIPGR